LEKALDSIYETPIYERDYVCKGFAKKEFFEEEKLTRYICSRSDRFKVAVAPYIKAIEHEFFSLPYFVKGESLLNLGTKFERLLGFPYYIQTDYSSFESSFKPEYMDVVECELFRYMLQNNKEILDLVMGVYYQRLKNGEYQYRINEVRNKNFRFYVQG